MPGRLRYTALMSSALRPHYTLEEYILLESMSNVRHEYVDGEIAAMAGGSPEHGGLCANVITALSNLLDGRPCRVFTSDVRVRIRATGLDTYPDVSVVCGVIERDDRDRHALSNPVVLVEVTSPSTEAYDRGQKVEHYKRIPSLREIVIVSHVEPRLDVWQRADDGAWGVYTFGAGSSATLPSIGAALSVDAVYRDPLAGA
jgi:Uma2 family endonuclease